MQEYCSRANRRVSYGIGMERIFPLHSPRVESITVIRQGKVRRSKLYYIRDLSGKKARLSETRRKRFTKGHEFDFLLPTHQQAKVAEEAPPAEDASTEDVVEAAAEESEVTTAVETKADDSAEETSEESASEEKSDD